VILKLNPVVLSSVFRGVDHSGARVVFFEKLKTKQGHGGRVTTMLLVAARYRFFLRQSAINWLHLALVIAVIRK
jgi:hypothetical protein